MTIRAARAIISVMTDFYDKAYEYEKAHLAEVIAAMKSEIEKLTYDGYQFRTVDFYDEAEVFTLEKEATEHERNKRFAELLTRNLNAPYFARMQLEPSGRVVTEDLPTYGKRRNSEIGGEGESIDMYVGRDIIFANGKILVYSHNSALGNKIYERINGVIEHNGYRYKVILRRKFDIVKGELIEVFQDYTDGDENGAGLVYDKFLARMLERKRSDKRLTDIIPSIQANQNAIIVRPETENLIVQGCAGSGKTMILLQRLEYLKFNKKLDAAYTRFVVPTAEFAAHVKPVMSDLHVSQVPTVTAGELYRELACAINPYTYTRGEYARQIIDDGDSTPYNDEFIEKLKEACVPIEREIARQTKQYKREMEIYEQDKARAMKANLIFGGEKPTAPKFRVNARHKRFAHLIKFGEFFTRAEAFVSLMVSMFCFGKRIRKLALFVDEAQDYSRIEFETLKKCATECTLNLFGDRDQKINEIGTDWSQLSGFTEYTLNENYRNSREITEFVNDKLNKSVTALGLNGERVNYVTIDEARAFVTGGGDDRVAVVTKDKTALPSDFSQYCYTVKECKGLEFERVLVIEKDMTARELYVAYTRALNTLCILKA